MRGGTLSPIALFLAAAPAAAEVAYVNVVRNNPVGTALPGEEVGVRVIVQWSPDPSLQFAGLRGDVVVTSSLGVSSNVGSAFTFGSGPPLVSLGTPSGGSVFGTDIATLPGFFLGSPTPPSIQWWGVNFLTFTWTSPQVSTPTLVRFDFIADPIAPNVRLYPSASSPAFIEAETVYTGMSITVLPGAGAWGVLGVGFMVWRGRRVRPPSGGSVERAYSRG